MMYSNETLTQKGLTPDFSVLYYVQWHRVPCNRICLANVRRSLSVLYQWGCKDRLFVFPIYSRSFENG